MLNYFFDAVSSNVQFFFAIELCILMVIVNIFMVYLKVDDLISSVVLVVFSAIVFDASCITIESSHGKMLAIIVGLMLFFSIAYRYAYFIIEEKLIRDELEKLLLSEKVTNYWEKL